MNPVQTAIQKTGGSRHQRFLIDLKNFRSSVHEPGPNSYQKDGGVMTQAIFSAMFSSSGLQRHSTRVRKISKEV